MQYYLPIVNSLLWLIRPKWQLLKRNPDTTKYIIESKLYHNSFEQMKNYFPVLDVFGSVKMALYGRHLRLIWV